jgi:hypothetical protein
MAWPYGAVSLMPRARSVPKSMLIVACGPAMALLAQGAQSQAILMCKAQKISHARDRNLLHMLRMSTTISAILKSNY